MLYVVLFGAVLVIGLLILLRAARKIAAAATARATYLILETLYTSQKPLNLTEIKQTVACNSPLIVNAIKVLHTQEMISSTHPMTNLQAALDNGRYSITQYGRDEVRHRRSAAI